MRILKGAAFAALIVLPAVAMPRTARAEQPLSEHAQKLVAPLFEEARTGFSNVRKRAEQKERKCLKEERGSTVKCIKEEIARNGEDADFLAKCITPSLDFCSSEGNVILTQESDERMAILSPIKMAHGNNYEDLDAVTRDRLSGLEAQIQRIPSMPTGNASGDKFTEKMVAHATTLQQPKPTKPAELKPEKKDSEPESAFGRIVHGIWMIISGIAIASPWIVFGIIIGWNAGKMKADGTLQPITKDWNKGLIAMIRTGIMVTVKSLQRAWNDNLGRS